MSKVKVIPIRPASLVKSLRLCPTICDSENSDSTVEYYRSNFHVECKVVSYE